MVDVARGRLAVNSANFSADKPLSNELQRISVGWKAQGVRFPGPEAQGRAIDHGRTDTTERWFLSVCCPYPMPAGRSRGRGEQGGSLPPPQPWPARSAARPAFPRLDDPPGGE